MTVYCGHVYRLFIPIAGKDKLVVPAYISPEGRARFFVINTNRTDYQINNPRISSHIIHLPVSRNQGILHHDSWLTCHELIGGATASDLVANVGWYRGPLDMVTTASVRQIILHSRLYSEIQKTSILKQWP